MSSKTTYNIHSIKFNAVMNMVLKISLIIFPLITFPYVTRVLQAEAYGEVNFAASVISYFSLLASMGIPAYGIRKCAEVRDSREKLSKTVKELLIINSISLFVTYLLFLILLVSIPKFWESKQIMLVTSISIILQTFGVEWFYEAIEQYSYITVRNIAFKVASLVLLFLLVHSPSDAVSYAGINVLGTVGSNILNIIRLNRYVDLKIKVNLDLQVHLKPIFVLFFYYAATTIYTNLDSVMLGFMKNNLDVGYYNSGVKIKILLVSLITAIGGVALPRISYYIGCGQNEKFLKLVNKSFKFVVYISLPLTVLTAISSKNIILLLAGSDFLPAVSCMMISTLTVLFIGLGSVTAYQVLIPLKKDRITMTAAIAGALVDLGINYMLIPSFGATGAAVGTLLAELTVISIHIFGMKEIFKKTFPFIEFFRVGVSTFVASVLTVVLLLVLKVNVPFFVLLISTAIFGITFLVCCNILKVETQNVIFKFIQEKLSLFFG